MKYLFPGQFSKMERKLVFILFLYGAHVVMGIVAQSNPIGLCNIRADDRRECGWFGIDKMTCERNRGCCWDSSIPNAKFCFQPNSDQRICNVKAVNRFECGGRPISRALCEKKGCCWNTSIPNSNIPFCFYSNNDKRGHCNVRAAERSECGWFGIDKKTCENKGCCWDSSIPNGKFCFYSSIDSRYRCDISAAADRFDCGWLRIDKDTCLQRGCCWDDKLPNANFCYMKKWWATPDGFCPVAPSQRKACGYDGITKQECLNTTAINKICCWDDTVPDTTWCFEMPDETPTYCQIEMKGGICKWRCEGSAGHVKNYGHRKCKGRICCTDTYTGRK